MTDLAMSLDRFTYKDYKNWPEDYRCELIDGVVYMMASPLAWHQRMVLDLGSQLSRFFEGKTCEPFVAPFDVRLFPQLDESDEYVVQPDVFVVCDEKKLEDERFCNGAPDFIIEVISPSSKSIDLMTKKNLYQQAGVREYWVVGRERVYVYLLNQGRYDEFVYDLEATGISINVTALPGCVLKLNSSEQ